MRVVTALSLAALGAVAIAAQPAAPYKATVIGAGIADRSLTVGGVRWRCKAGRCRAEAPLVADPAELCAALAAAAGPVNEFRREDAVALDADALFACNAVHRSPAQPAADLPDGQAS